MEDKQSSNKSKEKFSGDLPVYLRLMEVFLKQVEQSTPLLETTVKDIQANYISGVHTVLKAGEAMESKSRVNMNLVSGFTNTFDKVTPIITEAQLGVTEAIIDSARQSVQLFRKSITERK